MGGGRRTSHGTVNYHPPNSSAVVLAKVTHPFRQGSSDILAVPKEPLVKVSRDLSLNYRSFCWLWRTYMRLCHGVDP